MDSEDDKEKEDKILEALNKRLDEEKEEQEIEEEVEKRLEEREKKKEKKPKDAVFKGKDGKRKKVERKETLKYQCPRCGSTNLGRYSEEEPIIFKIRGTLYDDMLYCKNCGAKRLGVLKE